MFKAVVTIKKAGNEPDEIELSGISHSSTGYEYGKALADAISVYIENRTGALVSVYDDAGALIHKLQIVPKSGSVMITENGTDTMPLKNGTFRVNEEMLPEKYLVMVNPEYNNNKFYRMADLGGGKWGAFYGRIGTVQGESQFSSHVSVPYKYPDYMFALKLKEKLLKGYRDVTEFHIKSGDGTKKQDNSEFEPISDEKVADLVKRLMQFAKETIQAHYTVSENDVTSEMIEAARKQIGILKTKALAAVDEFNNALLDLMHIIPRRIDGSGESGVLRMMAKKETDYNRIIIREEDLLDVMEGQVAIHEKQLGTSGTILDAIGIELYTAKPEQRNKVECMLDAALQSKLKEVYRAINHKTQKRFDDYLAAHGGKAVKIRQFWHGSRNENWISILQKGLLLNPNALITGKMFGQGVYFAPSAAKSWGYTSARGAAWTEGTSDSAFMAVYATAYGKPYDVFSYDDSWYDYDYDQLKRDHPDCSCVHAKKDKGMLRNDEVVFYREDQMTINYICEFEA